MWDELFPRERKEVVVIAHEPESCSSTLRLSKAMLATNNRNLAVVPLSYDLLVMQPNGEASLRKKIMFS